MSYKRVIPRDLFNEANLLKCYGKLWIELEKLNLEKLISHVDNDLNFDIVQDIDGDLTIDNVYLRNTKLRRPLNSRDPWPLYAMHDDIEYVVFCHDGTLTDEFKKLLKSLEN